MVNDIIEYIISYLRNNYKNKLEKLDIKDIINFCKNILKSLLITKDKDKDIYILIEYDPIIDDKKFIIYSDSFHIKQILLNFISSSIKFTKTRFIKLKAQLEIKENKMNKNKNIKNTVNNNILKLSVIDSGMGMNEDEIKNIFHSEKNFSKKDYN